MKLSLTLDYALAEGWLSPWVEGLRNGQAFASCCAACGDTRFPPVRRCPSCDASNDGWRLLDGHATVLFRTAGADGDFALARFDGAQGAAIVQADRLAQSARRGMIAAVPDGPPALILEPETQI